MKNQEPSLIRNGNQETGYQLEQLEGEHRKDV